MYSVNGRNAATAATADHAVWTLWNPHATQRIRLVQFAMSANTAGAASWAGRLRRITARGTAGSTVTPVITAHSTRGIAPPSGALLDLAAFTVQPTLDTAPDQSLRFTFAAVAGAAIVYPIPGGIEIPPGTGISFIQIPATASIAFDISVVWLEDW